MKFWTNKNISWIALGALLLSSLLQLLQFYQTRSQLISPIIPRSTAEHLAGPFMQSFLFSVPLLAMAIIIHFMKKYTAVIIFCAVVIVLQQYYPVYMQIHGSK